MLYANNLVLSIHSINISLIHFFIFKCCGNRTENCYCFHKSGEVTGRWLLKRHSDMLQNVSSEPGKPGRLECESLSIRAISRVYQAHPSLTSNTRKYNSLWKWKFQSVGFASDTAGFRNSVQKLCLSLCEPVCFSVHFWLFLPLGRNSFSGSISMIARWYQQLRA